MEHTPGPWRVGTEGYRVYHGGSAVAGVFGSSGHGQMAQEAEANARLIAAAPELYEALEEIVTLWSEGDLKDVDVACETARGALAKARGEVA